MPEGVGLFWDDRGRGRQSFARDGVGDFTLLRADGHWPITSLWSWTTRRKEMDVVRGADLLSATACHLALQQALHFNEPHSCMSKSWSMSKAKNSAANLAAP